MMSNASSQEIGVSSSVYPQQRGLEPVPCWSVGVVCLQRQSPAPDAVIALAIDDVCVRVGLYNNVMGLAVYADDVVLVWTHPPLEGVGWQVYSEARSLSPLDRPRCPPARCRLDNRIPRCSSRRPW